MEKAGIESVLYLPFIINNIKMALGLTGRIEMFKKLIIFLMLFSFIAITIDESQAGLFKRNKTSKKQSSKKEETTSQAEQGKKILVVEIFASWCPGCKNIQPTLDQLVKEVSEINLVQLDVSTPSKAKQSAKQAQELKIEEFFQSNKSKTATVGIIVPDSGEVVSVFQNNNKSSEYKTAIDEAKTKQKSLQSPEA